MKTIELESGAVIKIGRTAQENFQLIDSADPQDLWFHLKGLPSCHVILSISSHDHHQADIERAAQACLANTKYRGMNSVYVEYLPVKYVEKTITVGRVILRRKPTYLHLQCLSRQ